MDYCLHLFNMSNKTDKSSQTNYKHTICSQNKKRKYEYPNDFINKNGTLNKNKRKKIYKWRQHLKYNIDKQNINKLQLENYKLKKDILNYQNALEQWVILYQNH
jgi:hypothetical protein